MSATLACSIVSNYSSITPGVIVQRLLDGLYLDWNTGTFDSNPTTPVGTNGSSAGGVTLALTLSPITVLSNVYRAAITGLTVPDFTNFINDSYIFFLIDNNLRIAGIGSQDYMDGYTMSQINGVKAAASGGESGGAGSNQISYWPLGVTAGVGSPRIQMSKDGSGNRISHIINP